MSIFNPLSTIHHKVKESSFFQKKPQNSKLSLKKDKNLVNNDLSNPRQALAKAKQLTEEELLIITVGLKRRVEDKRSRKRARKYSSYAGGRRSSRGSSGGIGDAIGDFFEAIGDIFDAFN